MSTQVSSNILNDANSQEIIRKMNTSKNHKIIEKPKPLPLSEDPRTLQLALELSLVGLNDNQPCYTQASQSISLPLTTQNNFDLNNLNVSAFSKPLSHNGLLLPNTAIAVCVDDRSKKSQNMTECVPVPSSEHVAEIVGRQGCKIKALRAKTNTYIKTPVRGEEPVFVVTGRKEDVNKAKREILSAADHFSLIRASRKPLSDGQNSGSVESGSCSNVSTISRMQAGPPCIPGQITIQVRVPYRVVGLVVGPKGATIKHIQHETQTYIVTPSREKEPIFEVTGLPGNVDSARKQIEAHIALRTGSGFGNFAANIVQDGESIDHNDFGSLPPINSLAQILNDDLNSEILSSIYTNSIQSADYLDNKNNSIGNEIDNLNIKNIEPLQCHHVSNCNEKTEFTDLDLISPITAISTSDKHVAKKQNVFRNATSKALSFFPPASTSASIQSNSAATILTRSCSSASSTTSTKSMNNRPNTPPEIVNIWKNIGDSIDIDEGIGDSPSIWNQPNNILPTAHCSPTASISPTDSLLGFGDHGSNKTNLYKTKETFSNNYQKTQSNQVQPSADKLSILRECFVCNENEVTTALVPCGHNMFCMECANQICLSIDAICPVCNSIVYHAMRILG
ncbi:uncharacterized protein Dana_GF20555 [Drosophila ananassae]|uniref:RING-type domain-containing protein n=1 Tax=Drosophila ananassae TaxID=7217 RepID=A0A0P8YKX4_DROAN|nr:RNA-binding protein MEX3B [Drosophila ananassae]XP_032308039.1 RNA-binding protein MEX3B [Drosophila ananassae]KPU81746.1 uncharacterized protein Dana_GF20555 [Drosophila ananassae]